MIKCRLLILLILFLIYLSGQKAYPAEFSIPVYIEDNHASSFYFFANNLDLDSEYTLLLFDRHSDAGHLVDSDSVRKALRNHFIDKFKKYNEWKRHGVIQSSNWIEPLMPKPISNVFWIACERLTDDQKLDLEKEVELEINMHRNTYWRQSGALNQLYNIIDFQTIQQQSKFKHPLIVSIDLDYFCEMSLAQIPEAFERLVTYLFSLNNLQAITVAISYPYLKSKEQADLLLYLTFKYFSNVINFSIQYEPFTDNGPDRSKKALEYIKKGLIVPHYTISRASFTLKSLILQKKNYIKVNVKHNLWEELLKSWEITKRFTRPELEVYKNEKLQNDLIMTVYFQNNCTVKLKSKLPKQSEVFWYSIQPKHRSYNVTGKKYEFAKSALSIVQYDEYELLSFKNKKTIQSYELDDMFCKQTGFGVVRIFAVIKTEDQEYRSNTVTLCKYKNNSYIGRLTELFNLPYILGGAGLKRGNKMCTDALYGSDCSNFIIYGKRRQGFPIPYMNPRQLMPYFEVLFQSVSIKNNIAFENGANVTITPSLINEGLILHFGTHVAAVYDDKSPYNVLDGNDLVIHQLDNYPEIIPFKMLKHSVKPFAIVKFKNLH